MKVDLIWLGGILTTLFSILGMLWKLHTFLNRIEDKFEKYDKTINDNTIYILKMALLSEDLPVSDRLEAGKLYLDMGGNGYGSAIYNRLLKEVENNTHI